MLISVVEFLGSCMVAQLSLWNDGEAAIFCFEALEFCCVSPPMPSSTSMLADREAGAVVTETTVAGIDSIFCLLGFCSWWSLGRKLPITT